MTPLQKAFLEWQSLFPAGEVIGKRNVMYTKPDGTKRQFIDPIQWNGECCPHRHTSKDEQVCDRERAWRRYVRLRDGSISAECN